MKQRWWMPVGVECMKACEQVAPVFTDLLQGTDIEFVHGTTSSIDHETRTLMVDLAAVAGTRPPRS
jgi:hypothetical protein